MTKQQEIKAIKNPKKNHIAIVTTRLILEAFLGSILRLLSEITTLQKFEICCQRIKLYCQLCVKQHNWTCKKECL